MTDLKKTIVGKVGSRKKLHEADIQYTPEKIEEFTVKARKDVEDLKKIFTSFRGKVENLTIGEMAENPEAVANWQEKLKQASKYASDKYDYYYNIVESYSYLNMPANVKELDALTDKLSNLEQNLKYVKYAMENMADAAKDFSRFYEEEDEQS